MEVIIIKRKEIDMKRKAQKLGLTKVEEGGINDFGYLGLKSFNNQGNNYV